MLNKLKKTGDFDEKVKELAEAKEILWINPRGLENSFDQNITQEDINQAEATSV